MIERPKSKEEFVNLYAGKIWDETTLVDETTGKFREHFIPVMRSIYLGLERFIEAQDRWNTYQKALEEVKSGKKTTHWIWYIFPQLNGLSKSEIGKFYGLSREEAEEYINHPVLRERLVEITEAVYNNENSVYEIFGNDAIKVRSCMLLFASVSDIPVFKKMVTKYNWR